MVARVVVVVAIAVALQCYRMIPSQRGPFALFLMTSLRCFFLMCV